MKALEGPCIADKSCLFTIGYYVGGGAWICFMHALSKGWEHILEDVEKRRASGHTDTD